MGPEKYAGPFDEPALLHLLRRTLFGINRSDLSAFRSLSLDEAVDALLEPGTLPDPPLNNYADEFPDPEVKKGDSWIFARPGWLQEVDDGGDITWGRLSSLRAWLLKHIMNQEPKLHHKMMLFWHNHFGNEANEVYIAKLAYQYFTFLWDQSYSNFRQLIKDVTVHPHMLYYLNGSENVKEAPDENFARELQELFCIGKGEGAAFTEEDIQEAARVLTGWTVRWNSIQQNGVPGETFFRNNRHEVRDKQFSSFYSNAVITGKSGAAGAVEKDELIDMIVEHPECAKFICRKLHRYFINSEITDETEVNFIEPLARLFRESNYEIRPVLKAMFSSAHFYDEQFRGSMIKSPTDLLIGFWRSAEVAIPEGGDWFTEDYYIHVSLHYRLQNMGFEITDPPGVSGWPAYYQIPSYDKLWITTHTLISRILVSDALTSWGLWTPNQRIHWNFLHYTSRLEDPADPNALIDEIVQQHLSKPLSDEIRNTLKGILLSGQATDSYWTVAWLDYENNPGNDMMREIVENRLRRFYVTLFQLPQYQLF